MGHGATWESSDQLNRSTTSVKTFLLVQHNKKQWFIIDLTMTNTGLNHKLGACVMQGIRDFSTCRTLQSVLHISLS